MPFVSTSFQSYTELGSFLITGTVFSLCRTSGAIYFSNANSNLSIINSGFSKCKNPSGAGCLHCEMVYAFVAMYICFYDCEAYRCPGYFICGYTYDNFIRTHMNFSCEYNPKVTEAASAFYGKKDAMFWNNNISSSNSNLLAAGLNVGSTENRCIGKFFNIADSIGPGFLRFHSAISPSAYSLSNFNVINHTNKPVSSWLVYATSHTISITNSVFISVTQAPILGGLSGSAIISSCFFEIPQNSALFTKCITSNNFYNTQGSFVIFDLFDTNICWGMPTSPLRKFVDRMFPITITLYIIT